MMDQKTNPILPPPSVDDLLALGPDARLGQVDFAASLTSSPAPAAPAAPTRPAAPPAAPAAPEELTDAPMATVTSVLPRRRVVEAVPEPEDETAPEPDEAPEPEPEAVEEPTKPAPRARTRTAAKVTPKKAALTPPKKAAAKRPAPKRTPRKAVEQPTVEPTPAEPTAGPMILPIAHLSDDSHGAPTDTTTAEDALAVEPAVEPTRTDDTTTLRMPMEPVEQPRPKPVSRTERTRPSVDSGYVGGTVQEVADAAMERLRDAENAAMRHLAAVEAEAARRAELLTAQAELDAELIRITARREAHAIISAARTQAGLGGQQTRDGRQLAEISDAVSRFAESIESSLEPLRSYPDHGDRT